MTQISHHCSFDRKLLHRKILSQSLHLFLRYGVSKVVIFQLSRHRTIFLGLREYINFSIVDSFQHFYLISLTISFICKCVLEAAYFSCLPLRLCRQLTKSQVVSKSVTVVKVNKTNIHYQYITTCRHSYK